MALHRLNSLTLGVPDLHASARFYEDFGLRRSNVPGEYVFATEDGGDQLILVQRPTRRLVEATFAADDPDDIRRVVASLLRLGVEVSSTTLDCAAVERATGVLVRVVVAPRLQQDSTPAPVYNGPGRIQRVNARADGVVREHRVRPRKLGHFVLGTTDFAVTKSFFVDGLGFRVSDIVKDFGVFLRCSTDHHNLLVQKAPVPFLHHTSWQVEDVDEVGRGAMDMLAGHPDRHVWGLGRHYAGSNFFWYLKDPSGNFAEYHSDMDHIPEDALWTPEILEGARGLFTWGPPPPASFLDPEDLADLMISGHG
ncbi:VOC family protein [Kribbella sp. CA-253562]|uniref:VOC family protein n=1 Tax=Kribbella sp. CA-253562 TaxID=3239942 RepID=UPI003D89CFFE